MKAKEIKNLRSKHTKYVKAWCHNNCIPLIYLTTLWLTYRISCITLALTFKHKSSSQTFTNKIQLRYIFIIYLFIGPLIMHGQVQGLEIVYPWSEDIKRIKEDSLGFIWFHDGYDFYRYNGHQVIASNLGKSIGKNKYEYELKGDIIFLGDQFLFNNDNRLSLFHPYNKTISNIWQLPPGLNFEHIYEDDLGDIWVFTSSPGDIKSPVFLSQKGGAFKFIIDLLPSQEDSGIFWDFEVTDKDGTIYIHDRLGGLIILSKEGKLIDLEVADQEDFDQKLSCSQFRLDNKNYLWRIWQDQFEIYNPKNKKFEKHPISGAFELQNFCNRNSNDALLNLRSIYRDSKDRIWLLNAAAYLLLYDNENPEIISLRKDLVEATEGGGHDIEALYEDKYGNIWGHKKGGIFKIIDKTNYFESYTVNTSNKDHPIYQDTDNKTLQQILEFYDDFAIKNTSVHSIAEDSQGNIYYQDGTLTFKIDQATKEIEILPFFTPKEKVHLYVDDHIGLYASWDSYYSFDKTYKVVAHDFPVNRIEHTYRQSNGTLWMSGLIDQHNFMFGKVDQENLEYLGNFIDDNNIIDFSEIRITGISEDDNSNLWLSSDNGLLYVNTKNKKVRKLDRECTINGSPFQLTKGMDQVVFLKKNLIWFKSKKGIGLLNTLSNELERYLPIDERILGEKLKFIPDGDSVIWSGNKNGIGYYNFNNEKSIQLSVEEGIDARGEVRVLKKLRNGKIAVGTNNGLYTFSPNELLEKHTAKENNASNINLLLTSVSWIDGEYDSTVVNSELNYKAPMLELNYDDKMLSLQYSLMMFSHPWRHLYEHKLEGYETEWSSAQNTNITSYSSLPPGDYTFKVRATSGNGIYSNKILSVDIKVHPAWFNAWWFRLLLVMVISYIAYLVAMYRYRELLKYQKLRSDISQNLHDDVGSMLTGIAMQSELLENYISEKLKPTANKIAMQSREAIGRMRDTVWAIDSRKDTTVDLESRILDYMEDTLIAKNILINFDSNINNQDLKIPPNLRQNTYLIIKETINNIAKHSDTKNVKIDLSIKKKSLDIKIKDYGSHKKVKQSGQGIGNMQKRAETIGASYTFVYHEDGFLTNLIVPI